MSINTNNLHKNTPILVDNISRDPEYLDHYPECPDPQVRSFRAYIRSFPRGFPNPEYPSLYPEFCPYCSKPGVSGLIPGVSGPQPVRPCRSQLSAQPELGHRPNDDGIRLSDAKRDY